MTSSKDRRWTRRRTAPDISLPANGTFPRRAVTLLAFGLAALFGEWLVHQLAYLIEYGSRFDAVMAGTPHRYYMATAGVLLAVVALLLLSLMALVLSRDALKRRRWVALLPARVRRFVPAMDVQVPLSAVAFTGIGLACWQISVYLIQENLEATAAGSALPGLGVLVAPGHWPVIPLHLVVAFCCALVLWTLSGLLNGSREATATVERLVRFFAFGSSAPESVLPLEGHLPNHRLIAGARSLRSPPLAA